MGSVLDFARRLLDDRDAGEAGSMRVYLAGERSRSLHGFVPTNIGPNVANESSLRLARARVRALMLDNPIIGGAQDIIRDNVVGLGIRPMPNTRWPEINNQLEGLLEQHENAVDPERTMTLGQAQGQWFDEIFAAGDCLTYYPIADVFRGSPAGPSVELIDSDRVDIDQTGPLEDGRVVRQGVELDTKKRVFAYHVLREHPFDGYIENLDSLRRPHDRIEIVDGHLGFVPRRIKSLRGVPWPVKVVRTGKLEDQYHEANLLLMQAAASVGLVVKGGAGQNISNVGNNSAEGRLTDANGNEITQLRPGLIGHVPHNVDVTMLNPNIGGTQVAEMTSMLLRRIASGLNVSYSALARDYARSSFAAQRAEALQDRRGYRRLQRVVWWQGPGFGWYWRLVRWWIVTGQINMRAEVRRAWVDSPDLLYRHSVIAPGWEWVDPLREAQAETIALDNVTTSVQRLTAARGERWRDVIDEQLDAEQYESEQRKKRGMSSRPEPRATAVAAAGAGSESDDEADDAETDEDADE